MLEHYSWLSKLIVFYCHKALDIFLSVIPYGINASRENTYWNQPGDHLYSLYI